MEFDPRLAVEERPDVYQPSDDSYLLLETIRLAPGERFLEVGTGTGLIALHAARIARVTATDTNPEAASIARRNAKRNRLRFEVVLSDLMTGVRGPFDVVAFNPPYLDGNPTDHVDRAWQGGDGGSAVALRFLQDLSRVLRPGGRAYLLLSRTNQKAWEAAHAGFRTRVVRSKRLFFEELAVLEITREGP